MKIVIRRRPLVLLNPNSYIIEITKYWTCTFLQVCKIKNNNDYNMILMKGVVKRC